MNDSLRDFVQSHPIGERGAALEQIAEAAGVKTSAVRHWTNGIRTIPAERVIAVEKATGVSRHHLRPDIFGPPPAEAEAAAG